VNCAVRLTALVIASGDFYLPV